MYRDNMLKNKRIEIRVSNKELVSIRNTAKRNNTTVSNILRKRIRSFLKKASAKNLINTLNINFKTTQTKSLHDYTLIILCKSYI